MLERHFTHVPYNFSQLVGIQQHAAATNDIYFRFPSRATYIFLGINIFLNSYNKIPESLGIRAGFAYEMSTARRVAELPFCSGSAHKRRIYIQMKLNEARTITSSFSYRLFPVSQFRAASSESRSFEG